MAMMFIWGHGPWLSSQVDPVLEMIDEVVPSRDIELKSRKFVRLYLRLVISAPNQSIKLKYVVNPLTAAVLLLRTQEGTTYSRSF